MSVIQQLGRKWHSGVVLKDSGCGDGHLGDSGSFSEMPIMPKSDTRNVLKVTVRAFGAPMVHNQRRLCLSHHEWVGGVRC